MKRLLPSDEACEDDMSDPTEMEGSTNHSS